MSTCIVQIRGAYQSFYNQRTHLGLFRTNISRGQVTSELKTIILKKSYIKITQLNNAKVKMVD